MKALVTGGAGFIGSHIVDRLLSEGCEVVIVDTLETGFESNISSSLKNPKCTFHKVDIQNLEALKPCFNGVDTVFHLAANADVRDGLKHPEKDLNYNTIGTFNVLEAMRANGCKRIVFSSTGSVYGEAKVIPTQETEAFPIQTSLYGASKVAGESLIQAYAEGYGMQGFIFRFVSIMGERYSHGHVIDFYRKLKKDPSKLEVLGNGKQKKSYLYVGDCVDAIFLCLEKCQDKINIFNLGTDEIFEVNDSIKVIVEAMNLKPSLEYTGGERGWVGDNPHIHLDISKMRSIGWEPKLNIKEAVERTISYLMENE